MSRLPAAFAACDAVAAAKNAALYQAAQELDAPRYRFFLAAYASMRLIDDLVDERFLAAPPAQRRRERAATEAAIAAWLAQIHAAKAGRVDTTGPLPAEICSALCQTLGRSDLDPHPWARLADALRADVAETPLHDWDDFLNYCEGATAAPAAIFVYVLSCRTDPEQGYLGTLARTPLSYARDMAIFCYLIHILRDLPQDVNAADRLITIPTTAFEAAGLTPATLRRALKDKAFETVRPLADLLLERAGQYLEAAQAHSIELLAQLTPQQGDILGKLFAVYVELATVMSDDYPAFLARRRADRP